MDEFDLKTSNFRAIYNIFGVKLAVFFCQRAIKNEFWPLDLILDQI